MYNRYIPQADGSYRRSQIPEPEPEMPQEPVSPEPEPPKPPPRSPGYTRPRQPPQHRRMQQPETNPGSVAGFLKGLLPANFDTEDLIVVLLLLLMSGSSGNDQNAALMTLGIYLFM